MSRQVDRNQPLSEEDRQYLLNHGEDAVVALMDERFPEAVPEEPMTPDLDPGFTGTGTREVPPPGAPVEDPDDEDPGYEEWSAEDLRAEIDERNEKSNGDTKISKAGSRADMAARLRDADEQASV